MDGGDGREGPQTCRSRVVEETVRESARDPPRSNAAKGDTHVSTRFGPAPSGPAGPTCPPATDLPAYLEMPMNGPVQLKGPPPLGGQGVNGQPACMHAELGARWSHAGSHGGGSA